MCDIRDGMTAKGVDDRNKSVNAEKHFISDIYIDCVWYDYTQVLHEGGAYSKY